MPPAASAMPPPHPHTLTHAHAPAPPPLTHAPAPPPGDGPWHLPCGHGGPLPGGPGPARAAGQRGPADGRGHGAGHAGGRHAGRTAGGGGARRRARVLLWAGHAALGHQNPAGGAGRRAGGRLGVAGRAGALVVGWGPGWVAGGRQRRPPKAACWGRGGAAPADVAGRHAYGRPNTRAGRASGDRGWAVVVARTSFPRCASSPPPPTNTATTSTATTTTPDPPPPCPAWWWWLLTSLAPLPPSLSRSKCAHTLCTAHHAPPPMG